MIAARNERSKSEHAMGRTKHEQEGRRALATSIGVVVVRGRCSY